MVPRNEKVTVPLALYHATEKYIALGTVSSEQRERIIQQTMENLAVQTLEAIRGVLEDQSYDDPECFERVDALVMLFFQKLEVNIDRHNELE